jgi:hypothetical protein
LREREGGELEGFVLLMVLVVLFRGKRKKSLYSFSYDVPGEGTGEVLTLLLDFDRLLTKNDTTTAKGEEEKLDFVVYYYICIHLSRRGSFAWRDGYRMACPSIPAAGLFPQQGFSPELSCRWLDLPVSNIIYALYIKLHSGRE